MSFGTLPGAMGSHGVFSLRGDFNEKPIYILLLICALTLLPSCGKSREPQENNSGFRENGAEAGSANSII